MSVSWQCLMVVHGRVSDICLVMWTVLRQSHVILIMTPPVCENVASVGNVTQHTFTYHNVRSSPLFRYQSHYVLQSIPDCRVSLRALGDVGWQVQLVGGEAWRDQPLEDEEWRPGACRVSVSGPDEEPAPSSVSADRPTRHLLPSSRPTSHQVAGLKGDPVVLTIHGQVPTIKLSIKECKVICSLQYYQIYI